VHFHEQGADGSGGTAERSVLERKFDLNRGFAPAVQNFAAMDIDDGGSPITHYRAGNDCELHFLYVFDTSERRRRRIVWHGLFDEPMA
jgi:hypothetical protein